MQETVLILLALVPIVLLIVLLGVFKVSGDKSALITLVVTFLLAILGYGQGVVDASLSFVYGGIKALVPILFIILMAIYSYNVLQYTKAIDVLKEQFSSLSTDRSIQVLLITWGFGGLLEGMAGFGTAVAIPAAILIGLGFRPIFSALVSLLANSVATGFGAVGVPVTVLGTETGLPAQALGVDVILQLSPLMILIPLALTFLSDPRLRALPKNIILGLLVGIVSLLAQYAAVKCIGVETPAILGSLAAIVVILAVGKLLPKGKEPAANTTQKSTDAPHSVKRDAATMWKAWAVYGFIMLLILLTSPLIPPINSTLKGLLVSKPTLTIGGTPHGLTISWLTQGGLLLFLGSLLGGLVQGGKLGELLKVLGRSVWQLRKTIVTVICLVGFSSIMETSGMIALLASGLAGLTGAAYPFVAPAVGALGTFVTGSDTSSNILFGKLQAGVAEHLNVDPTWLAASNTAGATGGKIISPQSIAIATSACQMPGEEGPILKKAVVYALVYVAIAGVVVGIFI